MPAATPTSPYVLIDGARILYAPLASTLPADSVALGGDWPVAWKEIGYTTEPAKVTTSFDVYKLMVQQRSTYIYKKKTSSDVRLETRMADFSADSLKLTMGGNKTTVAATSGVPPVDVYTYVDDIIIPANMWAVEGGFIFDPVTVYPVRIFLFSASPSEGTDFEINREREAAPVLNLEAASISDGSVYQIRWVVGAPGA